MLGGLIIVPVVSLITKPVDKQITDDAFSCYDRKVTVSAKDDLGN